LGFRFGIIGLGIMGRRMLGMIERHGGFAAIVAYDPRADDLPIPREPSVAALLARPDLDAIYIATPPEGHLDAIRLVAARRLPLFCEKPLAATIAEADTAVAIVKGAGLACAVNFPFATAPAATGLLELVRSGRIGAVQEVRLRLRFAQWPRPWQRGAAWLADAPSGGFTREVASHFIFLLQRLFGPGVVLDGTVSRSAPERAENRVTARLRFGDQLVAYDGAVEGEIDDRNELLIIGTHGQVRLYDWLKLERDGLPATEGARDGPGQLDGFADLMTGKPSPLASFEEAAGVVRLVETLLAGAG
jgi:predicted dehydrogenase